MNSPSEQYELEIGYHGYSIERTAQYNSFEGLLGYCHQANTFAWIYTDRLRFKYNREPDEEGSHLTLFGRDAMVACFRGWYLPEKKLVTICDRSRVTQSPDELPEFIYRALRRQFNPQHWRVL